MGSKNRVIYVISDTHFSHQKIVESRGFGSIEEHDRYLREEWNSVVREQDKVIHVGDFSLGGSDGVKNNAPYLNGEIVLVKGNHDTQHVNIYLNNGISHLEGCYYFRGVLFTHMPVCLSQNARFPKQIHGHRHAGESWACTQAGPHLGVRYNACVDVSGYRPRRLTEIKAQLNKMQDDSDQRDDLTDQNS